MDPLGDLLKNGPIQTAWEISIEPCWNWWFWCIDNPDHWFVKVLIPTLIRTRCNSPEPLLTLWKGCTGHANVVYTKSKWKSNNTLDIILPVTDKWESKTWIRDKIYYQNWYQWCQTSHRRSGHCAMWTLMNDSHHAALIHASHCKTLSSDLLPMVEFLKIAYGMSWRLRTWSWIRKGEEVGPYMSETSGWICMQDITRRKHWIAKGLHCSALKKHV